MRFPGFIGPSYELQSVNVDAQRTLNLFPEVNKLGTGKSGEQMSLVPTPGLTSLLTIANTPIRGMKFASNGVLYVVASNKLYSVSSAWAATELGTLNTDTGTVSMADNGTHLFIVDGTNGYTLLFSGPTFAVVVDADFQPADQVTFQDGYFIFNQSGEGIFFISGLNDVTFDSTDFQTVEANPDDLVGLISVKQQLFLFGERTTEVYYNSGNADFPFERIQGAVIDVGCLAPFSIQNVQGRLLWLGGDETGNGVVYMMNGYQAERVSTVSIEAKLRALTNEQRAGTVAWSYQQGGHTFYCINVDGLDSTWCYDLMTGFWHERTYIGLFGDERHRAQFHALAYGVNVVADYVTGAVYKLDPDVYTDNGTAIARERRSPHLTDGLKRISYHSFQLDMETGVGLDGTGQGTDPMVVMQFSDDGGHTWSNEKSGSIGKIGQYRQRVKWNRLGSSWTRTFKVRVTEPCKVVLIGAEIEISQGLS